MIRPGIQDNLVFRDFFMALNKEEKMTAANIYRDVNIGQISEADIDKTLKVAGWVENIRDHGGVSFIDLRDRYGVLQVVLRDREV